MSDALLTPAETADRLRISVKLLREHVRAGEIRYIEKGRGTKRKRRLFHPDDVAAFVERRGKVDPCPSTGPRARRSGTTISNAAGGGFLARLDAEKSPTPARSNGKRSKRPELPSGHRADIVSLR